jgi:hypothetical protein
MTCLCQKRVQDLASSAHVALLRSDVGNPKLIDPGQFHPTSQIQVNLQLVLRIRVAARTRLDSRLIFMAVLLSLKFRGIFLPSSQYAERVAKRLTSTKKKA